MAKKLKPWKNLKENYMLVLPSTFSLILGIGLLFIFGVSVLKYLETIVDPFAKIIGLIVFVFAFMKLLSWIPMDLMNDWANKMHDGMAYGNPHQYVEELTKARIRK